MESPLKTPLKIEIESKSKLPLTLKLSYLLTLTLTLKLPSCRLGIGGPIVAYRFNINGRDF